MKCLRERLFYSSLGVVVMVLGLLWRKPFLHLPHFASKYGADSLWALLVFLGVRFLAPWRSVWYSAGVATAFSFAIEFSQLYHAPWIDAIRRTTLGHLTLGDVFNWPDFGSYVMGIAGGVSLDCLCGRFWKSAPSAMSQIGT
jgi:hypothetical protein